ncbi:MAG: hypothetical protein LBI04_01445 [Treponema sp.]|jgi:hypothetical protein|nr:hypothetical protein [Treponema sp.]
MKNRLFQLGMLVIALVFGMMFTGCEIQEDEYGNSGGYTFEFRVKYSTGGGAITKIEFINGSNKDASVLATETVNLSKGEMSKVYKVSGFSEKAKDDYNIFGVKVTFSTGGTYFGWQSATKGSKIMVNVSAPIVVMTFSDGNW